MARLSTSWLKKVSRTGGSKWLGAPPIGGAMCGRLPSTRMISPADADEIAPAGSSVT
jgi:hypothetical protein